MTSNNTENTQWHTVGYKDSNMVIGRKCPWATWPPQWNSSVPVSVLYKGSWSLSIWEETIQDTVVADHMEFKLILVLNKSKSRHFVFFICVYKSTWAVKSHILQSGEHCFFCFAWGNPFHLGSHFSWLNHFVFTVGGGWDGWIEKERPASLFLQSLRVNSCEIEGAEPDIRAPGKTLLRWKIDPRWTHGEGNVSAQKEKWVLE